MKIQYDSTNPYSPKFSDLGTIILDDGTRIYPKCQAVLDGSFGDPVYLAQAVSAEKDEDGEPVTEYTIFWTPVDGWQEIEEPEYHCDWDDFEVVELGHRRTR